MEYSLSPISSSSALQAAMTAISSHLRSNFNIMPSTVYLTQKSCRDRDRGAVGYQPMALDIIMVTCNSRPIPVCGTHPGLGGFQTLEVES